MPTFFGLLYVPFLLHYFVRILETDPESTMAVSMSFGLFFCLWISNRSEIQRHGSLACWKSNGPHENGSIHQPENNRRACSVAFLPPPALGAHPLVNFRYAGNLTDLSVCSFTPMEGGLWGLLIALAAVIGDLIASVLKRLAGVKDSGGAIPGIGGLLDLTDSLILAAPTGYFILQIIKP